jgi:unsaturated rhamnogalacturonyl hydrolase
MNARLASLVPMLVVALAPAVASGTAGTGGASGAAAATRPVVDAVVVTVANPVPMARRQETIAVSIVDLLKQAPKLELAKLVVAAGPGSDAIESQLVDTDGDEKPDQLVFQAGLAAGETRTFVVRPGDRRAPAKTAFKVYGRFVRERHDDFAWENDRVAHRMYGPDLETWKAEPLVSSGVDVWCKRVRRLVVNDWYMTDDYHRDSGEGADMYSVGKSRGCGGVGVWAGDKLHVSRNFVRSRVLANGPIRLVFELTYAPWDVGGKLVSEVKRVTLDAGKNFNRFDSVFSVEGATKIAPAVAAPLVVGIGIAKHPGGVIAQDKKLGWMRSWEPLKKDGAKDGGRDNGNLGCAVVTETPHTITDVKTTDTDTLMLVGGATGSVITYYVGSGWDRGGDLADGAAWDRLVSGTAKELSAPVRISMHATKVAALAAPAPDTREAVIATATAEKPWSTRVCDSVMAANPVLTEKWAYDAGLILMGCLQVGRATNDRRYFDYAKQSVDRLVDANGGIKGYKTEDYNLDNLNMGKVLFPLLAQATDPGDKDRYKKALLLLRSQIKTQPRTADGAFWHKQIYPHQMWLDGVYMASPFLAEYAVVFGEPRLLDDVARQVLLAEKHMRDPRSGLLFHGWDETKAERWANPKTGTSSQFWGRAMGWYAMGVVDVLEQMPKNHRERGALIGVLRRLAVAIAAVQDKTSGVWWQVLDAPARGANYEEASASSMFVYALAKGIKNGWLEDKTFAPVVARGHRGLIEKFVQTDGAGRVDVKSICRVAGLGGNPYRDGSFDYYTSTDVVANDPKGVGAFILANIAASSLVPTGGFANVVP